MSRHWPLRHLFIKTFIVNCPSGHIPLPSESSGAVITKFENIALNQSSCWSCCLHPPPLELHHGISESVKEPAHPASASPFLGNTYFPWNTSDLQHFLHFSRLTFSGKAQNPNLAFPAQWFALRRAIWSDGPHTKQPRKSAEGLDLLEISTGDHSLIIF